MKNKKVTYLLGVLVAIVWGVIIYRIFDAAAGNDDAVPGPAPVKKEAYNDYAIAKDTTHLLLNYRDPFGLTRQKDTVAPVKKINYKAVATAPKPAMNWGFIQYSGYIRNPASKKLITLISINGRSEMLSEGQEKDNVKLIKNLRDSIKISYNGKIKIHTNKARCFMKKIIIILFCCIAKTLFGQDLPNSGFEKVRLLEPGKEIVAEIRVPNKNVHAKKDLFYAWYQANAIHSTQGGYSGKLLNGQYTEYYPNKNLKEQGAYKNGLKTGNWRDWKEDGSLLFQHTWKDGAQLPDSTVSFWKKTAVYQQKEKPASQGGAKKLSMVKALQWLKAN